MKSYSFNTRAKSLKSFKTSSFTPPNVKKMEFVAKHVARREINRETEVKKYAGTFTGTADSTGLSTGLTAIVQGDNLSERIGREILLKNLSLRGKLNLPATADVYNWVRIFIIRHKGFTATPPTLTEMLGSGPYSGEEMFTIEPQVRDRFAIIYDKTFTLVDLDTNGIKFIKFSKSWKNGIKVSYSGTASTAYSNNHLFMYIIGSPANAGNEIPYAIEWISTYTDS